MLRARSLQVVNADLTVLAQAPKIAPVPRTPCGAGSRSCSKSSQARVNIKATTTEGLGFLGRAEGIAAQAVVLLSVGRGRRHRREAR